MGEGDPASAEQLRRREEVFAKRSKWDAALPAKLPDDLYEFWQTDMLPIFGDRGHSWRELRENGARRGVSEQSLKYFDEAADRLAAMQEGHDPVQER